MQWRCNRASDDTTVSSGAGMFLQRGLKLRPGDQTLYLHIRPVITNRLSPGRKVIAVGKAALSVKDCS